MEPIRFTVVGSSVTQGSKVAHVPTYKDGRIVRRHKRGCPAFDDKELARDGHPNDETGEWEPFDCACPPWVNVVDDNDGPLQTWRETIGKEARDAYRGEVLDCLVVLRCVFWRPRPKSHYGTGRNERVLKPGSPAAPGSKPDAGKLARAVEDALTHVIYTDDGLIVDLVASKRYCSRWEPERVDVEIVPLAAQTAGGTGEAVPFPDVDQLELALSCFVNRRCW